MTIQLHKFILILMIICFSTVSLWGDGHKLKFPIGQDKKFNWKSLRKFQKMKLSGETITIFGPWIGDDRKLVESVIAYFEKATGADVQYSGSDSFEQQVVIDMEGGSPPNIAVFPQPGLAADLAKKGHLIPLGEKTRRWVTRNYAAGKSWVDLGSYVNNKGKKDYYGFFYKVDLKSLVWYIPENFEDAGYKVPKTMEELITLSDQIVKDGGTPWCIGLGSGDATGWPATDWIEDLMLRTQKPEDYDKWVDNRLKFNDKKVVEAIEAFGFFAKNNKYVSGGSRAVASTDFRESPKGLFGAPPKCYMHRQASFIPTFFPEGTKLSEDVDFFYFPAYKKKKLGKPVLGAGTLFAIAKDSKGTRAFMDFLQTPIAHEVWMAQSGFLTPYKKVNLKAYANDSLRKQGEILLNATTFRFDGSDLMPGAIGAGAFWTGMVDYVSGKSAKSVANKIQKTWDSIK